MSTQVSPGALQRRKEFVWKQKLGFQNRKGLKIHDTAVTVSFNLWKVWGKKHFRSDFFKIVQGSQRMFSMNSSLARYQHLLSLFYLSPTLGEESMVLPSLIWVMEVPSQTLLQSKFRGGNLNKSFYQRSLQAVLVLLSLDTCPNLWLVGCLHTGTQRSLYGSRPQCEFALSYQLR